MLQPEVLPPETGQLKEQGMTLVEESRSIVIRNNSEYEKAGAFLRRVTGIRNAIVSAFADPKKKQWEAHRAICQLEATLLSYPQRAESFVKEQISAYRVKEEKERREAEAKIQADLKRQAEDRKIAEAEQLAGAGHQAEAEKILDEPIVAPVVELERPKAEGISTRRKWGYRVIDPAAHKREYMILDEKKVGQMVRALGPDAEKVVGGIQVVEETVVAVRA